MKKIKQTFKLGVIVFSSVLFFGNVSAQEEDASNSEKLEKGDIIIDLSYSLAGPKGFTWREIALNTNSDLSQLGPIGVKFQYMASESFGVGLDVSFTSRKGTWDVYRTEADSDTTYIEIEEPRAADQTIIRAMIRTSWEIIHKKSFQLFWANSIGYRSVNWKGDYDRDWLLSVTSASASSPLALRTAMGMRYFFTESIGLSVEFGLGGGSSVCLGGAIKL